MVGLFTRAFTYQNLTPLERSILRFVEAAILGALVAGLQAALPLLTDARLADPASIPWSSVLHTFLAALLVSLGLALRKFLAAQADPPIASASAERGTAPSVSSVSSSVSSSSSSALASAAPAAAPSPAAVAGVSVPDGVL